MKYCVPFYADFKFNKIVDEITINYSGTERGDIIEYINNFVPQEQTIIIDLTQRKIEFNFIIPILKKIYQEHEKIKIKIYLSDYDEVRELGIPFFFQDFCTKIDQIYGFINRGVCDVYITENLGFNLVEIGDYCHKNNVEVRVYPNISQYTTSEKKYIPDVCKFFIRPEDTYLYEDYVDIFEFNVANDRLSTLFEIYKNKQWLGDLKDIIGGIGSSIPNTGLVPFFGEQRIKCEHKCMLGKCNLCLYMLQAAKDLTKADIEIKRKRDNEWKEKLYEDVEKYNKDETGNIEELSN